MSDESYWRGWADGQSQLATDLHAIRDGVIAPIEEIESLPSGPLSDLEPTDHSHPYQAPDGNYWVPCPICNFPKTESRPLSDPEESGFINLFTPEYREAYSDGWVDGQAVLTGFRGTGPYESPNLEIAELQSRGPLSDEPRELEWETTADGRKTWLRKSGLWKVSRGHGGKVWLMFADAHLKSVDSIEEAQSLAEKLAAVLDGRPL